MKHLITIVLLVLAQIAFCQETEIQKVLNFSLQNGVLIWQRVFETTKTQDEVFNYFIQSKKVEEYEVINDKLSGFTQKIDHNNKLAGVSNMMEPMYLGAFDSKASVLIEFKDNRYRVTLSDMKFENNYSNPALSTIPYHPIEYFALNRKGIANSFKGISAEIMDTTFIDYFIIKEIKQNGNW